MNSRSFSCIKYPVIYGIRGSYRAGFADEGGGEWCSTFPLLLALELERSSRRRIFTKIRHEQSK